MRNLLIATILLGSSLTACLSEPFTGSTVQIDFLADFDPNLVVRMPDGQRSHYELWAVFGESGVLSIGRFVVDADYAVLDYPAQQTRIGSVFNVNVDPITASGVRFDTEARLEGATELFITIEADGETDAAPSGNVIMRGDLVAEPIGTLRSVLTGQYTNLLGETRNPIGEAAVTLAEDHAF